MKMQFARQSVCFLTAVALLAGCSKGSTSYSLLTDAEDYKQQAVLIPKKIDILWVIDNSGSMKTSQENLAANFQSFINRFQSKKYDFRMAVVTTDGFRKEFNPASPLAKIRDGGRFEYLPATNPRTYYTTSSGVFIMTNTTPDLATVFSTNIMQGILGDGDERPFQSLKQSLLEPANADFRRPEAFLAVIIVSDEEDRSRDLPPGQNGPLHPASDYVTFLNDYTETSVYGKNYSVSTIYVPDDACKTQLGGRDQVVSARMPELSDLTGGAKASLCEDFGVSLDLISDSIINLASVFKLSREPDPSTISVKVDGVIVPKDNMNGWSYNATDWTITFHGSSKPGADAKIEINFYPKSIKL